MQALTLTDPTLLRIFAPDWIGAEPYVIENPNSKFKKGQVCKLTGLVDFPEFDGQEVEITNIREDGENGPAYYIKGEINEYLNWVYEYRLEAI